MTTAPNWIESRKRSVENLQRIYTVVISLAVTEALKRVVGEYPSRVPAPLEWFNFVALLATVIPFFHGANRYLDATYVTGERTAVRYSLLLDFCFLFAEGVLFYALSLAVRDPNWFYKIYLALLALDILWVLTTQFTTRYVHREADTRIGLWAVINIVAGVLALLVYGTYIPETIWRYPAAQPAFFCIIAVLRSFFDYVSQWSFYYPKDMVSAG